MAADIDTITVITCKEQHVDNNQVQDLVKETCGEAKYDFVSLERETNHTIYQRIKKYLKDESNDDNYIDFIAVGSKGAASVDKEEQEYIGSVATLVLQGRNMNCIFVNPDK